MFSAVYRSKNWIGNYIISIFD